MKVTHVEDHVTHAVISGAQAIDFGISDSPEFFNILSSTLYTDQKLAVIRETLCNAWDAHIEFKCEHLAVEITLDDKYLTIRDFGPGIAPKMIGPVYGTYGGSTKAANGQVTGGFGLGCKAPFAYVDDFEVTSFHDGKYTIYRLSKSNAEVGGKPSIVPVVSDIPTTEHGLQVKIGIKTPQDRSRFSDLIHRIVQNGAMKMKLNGTELPTLPFDDMVHGFMLTKKKVQENFCAITIRYGNVIYPIQKEETYAHEWDEIISFLNRIASGRNHYHGNDKWSLVLQAAPNTVSVTPSRESLSNQKHTLATITELMREFLSVRDKKLHTECFRLLDERIKMTWMESSPAVLFETEDAIPNLAQRRDSYGRWEETKFSRQIKDRESLTNFSQFVEQYAVAAYPDFAGFKHRDRMRRIQALIQSGFGGTKGKKILKAYRRELLAEKHRPARYKKNKERYGTGQKIQSSWFHKEIVAPLIKGMNKENGLKPDKLFVNPKLPNYHFGRETMWPATKWNPRDLESMWPFARNIVILSFNKMDIKDGDADSYGISKFWLGKTADSLVYVCPRTEAKVEAARQYFTKAGVHLIDLTVKQHQAYAARQEKYIHTPSLKRPKRNGIPVLGKMRLEDGTYYNLANEGTAGDSIERVTEPKFVFKDGRRNPYKSFEQMTNEDTKLLLDMFGADGGFCANQNQYDRYINAGAVDWKDFIHDKLVDAYTNNPRIREWVPCDPSRLDTGRYNSSYYGYDAWYRIIASDQDLFEYFGLVDNRTDEDKRLIRVEKIFDNHYLNGSKGQRSAIEALKKTMPVSGELKELFESIKHSKLMQMLDQSGIQQTFVLHEANYVTEAKRSRIRDILLFAIEG